MAIQFSNPVGPHISQKRSIHSENGAQSAVRPQSSDPKHSMSGHDRVSLSGANPEQTESRIDGVTISSSYDLLRSLVIKTLQEQGSETTIVTGGQDIDLNRLTPEAAQELVAEDGYFGVAQTSQRIVDFAVARFGDDPARLSEMKEAIEDGFRQAAEAFGGSLPEISQQTHEAIMEKLDQWAEGSSPEDS